MGTQKGHQVSFLLSFYCVNDDLPLRYETNKTLYDRINERLEKIKKYIFGEYSEDMHLWSSIKNWISGLCL